MKTYNAFTLIELLVVISTIALLIGILLPTLSSARSVAESAACLSNQRQIGVAHALYATENKQLIVPPQIEDPTAGNFTGTNTLFWFEILADTMIGSKRDASGNRNEFITENFICPTFDVARTEGEGGNSKTGYGLNPYLVDNYEPGGTQSGDYLEYNPVPDASDPDTFPNGQFFTYDQMVRQSEWILNGDSYEPVGLKPSITGGNAYWRINPNTARRWRGGEPDRHSGMDYKDTMRANYAFVDGHASSVDADIAAPKIRDPEGRNGIGYTDPQ